MRTCSTITVLGIAFGFLVLLGCQSEQTLQKDMPDGHASMKMLFKKAADDKQPQASRVEAFRSLFHEAAAQHMPLSELSTLGDWERLVPKTNVADASTNDILPPFEPFNGSVMVLVLDVGTTTDATKGSVYVQLSESVEKGRFVDCLFGRVQPASTLKVLDAGWLSE